MKWIKILPALWRFFWIPMNFIFQQNPHFPSGLLAPAIGFISVFKKSGWSGNELNELTIPFFVFWSGFTLSFLISLIFKKKTKNN